MLEFFRWRWGGIELLIGASSGIVHFDAEVGNLAPKSREDRQRTFQDSTTLSWPPLPASKIKAVPLTVPNPRAHEAPESRALASPRGRKSAAPQLAAPAVLRFWHLASLDAPAVAAVWSLGFAWIVRARLPLWVLALQILVVWTVYVGDRLLDARAGLRRWGHELRERHFFHWRHRRIFTPLAVAAALAAACIVLHWMPVGARERDSLLAVASLAYFTRVHAGAGSERRMVVRRIFSKELLVGVLFTAGCMLPVWSRAHWTALALPIVFFAALAWLNCRAIERWEGGQPGLARAALCTAGAGIIAAAAMVLAEPRSAALLAAGACSALLLAGLDSRREHITAVTLRALADLVLLTPAFLLVAAWSVGR